LSNDRKYIEEIIRMQDYTPPPSPPSYRQAGSPKREGE